MNKALEAIMNFINENTTLLIIICVFLIFVLIGYLIDNSIKTRKMQKNLVLENYTEEPEQPLLPPNMDNTSVEQESPVVEEAKEEVIEEDNKDNNEIVVDEKVNDLLISDFTEKVKDDEVIDTVQADDTIELETISDNEVEEHAIEEPKEEHIVEEETPVVEEVKENSIYKNDKKLSDIFKKKEEPVVQNNESNELDRILQKLGEVSKEIPEESNDSTLDETTDFSNTF